MNIINILLYLLLIVIIAGVLFWLYKKYKPAGSLFGTSSAAFGNSWLLQPPRPFEPSFSVVLQTVLDMIEPKYIIIGVVALVVVMIAIIVGVMYKKKYDAAPPGTTTTASISKTTSVGSASALR